MEALSERRNTKLFNVVFMSVCIMCSKNCMKELLKSEMLQ